MLVAGSRKVSFVLLVLLFVGVFQMLWMMTAVSTVAPVEDDALAGRSTPESSTPESSTPQPTAKEDVPEKERSPSAEERRQRRRSEAAEKRERAERMRKWDNIMSRRADEMEASRRGVGDQRTGETVVEARERLRHERIRKRQQREEEAMGDAWVAGGDEVVDDGAFSNTDQAVAEEEEAAVEEEAEKEPSRKRGGGMGQLRKRRRDTGGLPLLGKPGDTRRMQNLDPTLSVRVSSGAKLERSVLFSPENDASWMEALRTARIVEAKALWAQGGSLPLFVRLEGGRRAVLKVQSTHASSWVNSEIAAYHLDRVLGFNRVPPCAGRLVNAEELFQRIETDNPKNAANYLKALRKRVVIGDDGMIECSMVAFLTNGVVFDAVPPALEAGHRGLEGWKEWVVEGIDEDLITEGYRITDLFPFLDMHVFDTLINNPDRYGPGNVLHYYDRLVLIDNSYGFFRDAPTLTKRERRRRWSLLTTPEMSVCSFNVETVDKLRAYDKGGNTFEIDLKESMQHEVIVPVLKPEHYEVLMLRVRKLLAHVDECSRLFDRDFVELSVEDYRNVFGTGPPYEDPDAARAKDREHMAWRGMVDDMLAEEGN